jgi:glutathione synthase/RimK-type ligase-like ATP-grasp enzyme
VLLASASGLKITDEDEPPLRAALAARGIEAATRAWDDPTVEWGTARACVLRSTWNYTRFHPEFLAWVDRCSALTSLWNPPAIVRWNSHKGYLVQLAARGLPVVPTRLLERGGAARLAEVASDWAEVVVKPAVAAGSAGALRVRADDPAGQRHLETLLATRDALVQPYFPSVATHGERAVVWIDGQFTHEVRKSPRFAGDAANISAPLPVGAAEREIAEAVLSAVPRPLLYARVDLARDQEGRPHLMELELVEPRLFLSHPPALDALADAIAARA